MNRDDRELGGRGPDRVSGFKDEKARQRFLKVYEAAFRKWPVPREELDVRTRFGTVHVHRSGDGPGLPIVLLHGLAATSAQWYPNVEALTAKHTVYALDALGEPGRSVQEKPIRDFADCGAHVEDALAGLGLDRVHLIGCSLGGWNAANHAGRYPERLASLTLLEPVHLAAAFSNRFIAASLLDAVARFLPKPLAHRLSSGTIPTDPDILRMSRAAMLGDFTIRLPQAGKLSDEHLRAITMPTLALLAEGATTHDSREVRARLNALLPAADVEICAGVGHSFPMTHPHLVNDRITSFIAAAEAG